MCHFSSFTCEIEVINTCFLFPTGSLRECTEICKVLLTKRFLCVSAKYIISNNTINKIKTPSQKCLKLDLLKEDTVHYPVQNKRFGPLVL